MTFSAAQRWSASGAVGQCARVTGTISAEIVALYATVYGHDRTTATTYINDNVVLCVLENILTEREDTLIDAGSSGEVIDAHVAPLRAPRHRLNDERAERQRGLARNHRRAGHGRSPSRIGERV